MKEILAALTLGSMRKIKILAVHAAFISLAVSLAGADGNVGKTFLVHAKTSLKLDDAQICAVPIDTVMSRVSRGKEQLRCKLQDAARLSGTIVPIPNGRGEFHG